MHPSDKPTIVVYANCAGQIIASELRRVPAIADRFEIHWIRNFSARAPGDEPFDEAILARCQVLFEQVGNFRGDPRRHRGDLRDLPVPGGCVSIRFPPLFMTTLWPFVALDPRSEIHRNEWMVEGPYPKYVCNRLIIDLMRDGADPDRVYQRFMEIRVKDHVDLDRLHEMTISKIRTLDKDSDVVVADLIERQFASSRLFRMQLHPAGPMLRHLCGEVFRFLSLPQSIVGERLDAIDKGPGIGNYDAPIHPDIIEHFDLGWARGLTYRHHSEGYFGYEEFIRRYIGLDWTPAFYRGCHLANEGRLAEAEPLLAEAARARPIPEFVEAHRWVRERLAAAQFACEDSVTPG